MADPDRVIAQTGTGPTVTGSIQDELTGLWDRSDLPLTNVGGTGDEITADLVPALTGAITAGMKFSFVADTTNTGAVTISINGGAAIDLVNEDGEALASGQILAGRLYRLTSDGSDLRVLGTSGITKINDYQVFTENGTWTKPAGTPDDALVIVTCIGGGGGGGNGTTSGPSSRDGGGGGGGGIVRLFRAGDLSGTETVTVGAGGAVATAGGNSTFGSHVTAYGGGQGEMNGGGGGSPWAAGGSGVSTPGTSFGGGTGGGESAPAGTGFVGGGGGGYRSGGSSATRGGPSLYGGGGGGGPSGAGGASIYGGAGGAFQANGTAPGGGGGGDGGAGARGEVRVHTIG